MLGAMLSRYCQPKCNQSFAYMASNGSADCMSGLSVASGKPLLYFGLCLPMSRRMVHWSVCWLSPYKLLRFAVRFELRRGTVGETVEFEHIEIGGLDEEVAVYR